MCLRTSDKTLLDVFDLPHMPKLKKGGISVIALCHNEALRLEYFFAHHKAIGVERFLIVDNASTDESAAIIRNEPAATLFPSRLKYSEYKSKWRELLADHYCCEEWVLFLDIDELFVYPGWPAVPLTDYCDRLARNRFEVLLTTMVDMYPEGVLDSCEYQSGQPFLETASFFDAGNYRMYGYAPEELQKWPTPPVHIRGGARERLFHDADAKHESTLAAFLNRTMFGMHRPMHVSKTRQLVEKVAAKWARPRKGKLGLPNMSKVPLIKWHQGCRFNGGVHRLRPHLPIAPDIGTLLHFKYLGDFAARAEYNAGRGQHVKGAAHYKHYLSKTKGDAPHEMISSHSVKFDGTDSLLEAGLMRDVLGGRADVSL